MNYGDNNDREIFKIFPAQIPKNAYDVLFYYNEEDFQDYTIEARLKFTTNSETISEYISLCESKKLNTIYNAPEWVDIVGNGNPIPDDFDIYLIINDYFEISIILINQNNNKVIFYACAFTI